MTFPIVQMVSCRGPPQNTEPQAITCLACPIATPVSPNPILCISGWNRIWITECPHRISQLFESDLCVHKRSFVFNECELVSMVMSLRCYAYAKHNSNSNTVCNTDVVLPSRLRCCIIFRLARQRKKLNEAKGRGILMEFIFKEHGGWEFCGGIHIQM